MSLVSRVRRTLERRRLVPGGAHVVVGCSGGPDSTALLYVLHELAPAFGLRVTAACIDHQLRPQAAEEAQLVRQHARCLGVSFHLRPVHVDRRRGLQAGARVARYQALQSLREELGADAVAVGHTRDDQAETVVARLLRTPSVHGLGSIHPVRSDGVVRPLIECSRAHVRRFVQQRGLSVADDPSNRDPAHTRVRVRHTLLPLLARENPNVIEALATLAEDARMHGELVEALAPVLDLAEAGARTRLREQPPPVRRYVLRRWLREHTGAEPRLRHIEALEDGRSLAQVLLVGDQVASWSADGALCVRAGVKRTRGR